MKNQMISFLSIASILLLLFFSVPTANLADAYAPDACKWQWAPIKSPNHPGPGYAHRIALRNKNDIWVAGSNIWHWDGINWTVALRGAGSNEFQAVTAYGKKRVYVLGRQVMYSGGKHWRQLGKIPLNGDTASTIAVVSKKNIWVAVSHFSYPSGPASSTWFVHWDGATWKEIGGPFPGGLVDMQVVNRNDIWAGGSSLLHWDGFKWNTINLPGAFADYINRIKAVSENDVWVVGSRRRYDGHANPEGVMAMHWDGANWTDIPELNASHTTTDGDDDSFGSALIEGNDANGSRLPAVYQSSRGFVGVAPVGLADIWLSTQSGLFHWDGTALTAQEAGPPTHGTSLFNDVVLDEANGLWLVGSFEGDNAWAQHQNGAVWDNFDLPGTPGITQTPFNAAVALAHNDVWVAGSYSGNLAMLVHWNGTDWSFADLDQEPGILNAIAAVNASDIWAVGQTDYYVGEPVFLHYDGTKWTSVPSPSLPNLENGVHQYIDSLTSLAVVSQDDVWAVGSIYTSYIETLILHWDGSTWSISPTPLLGGEQDNLSSVFALSANDVWAVGTRWDGTVNHTIVFHWDGSRWSVVPSLNLNGDNGFSDVAGLAPDDIWAVGYPTPGMLGGSSPLVHWDGKEWQSFVQDPSTLANTILTLAPRSLWGIGMRGKTSFVGRWNGKRWRVHWTSPKPLTFLTDITMFSPKELWAVGNENFYSLVVRGICE